MLLFSNIYVGNKTLIKSDLGYHYSDILMIFYLHTDVDIIVVKILFYAAKEAKPPKK